MAFRGLFGRKMFGNSSERDETMYPGGGVYGGGPGQQDDLAGRFAAAQQPEKQGFFQSDRGRNAIGTFADTLIKLRTGQDPGIMRNMQHRQNREFAEAQYEKKRQADYQDFLAKEAYKRANPQDPAKARDLEWYKGLSPEDRETYHAMNPEYRQGPDGRFYRIDVAGTAPAPQVYGSDLPPGFTLEGGSGGNVTGGF